MELRAVYIVLCLPIFPHNNNPVGWMRLSKPGFLPRFEGENSLSPCF